MKRVTMEGKERISIGLHQRNNEFQRVFLPHNKKKSYFAQSYLKVSFDVLVKASFLLQNLSDFDHDFGRRPGHVMRLLGGRRIRIDTRGRSFINWHCGRSGLGVELDVYVDVGSVETETRHR